MKRIAEAERLPLRNAIYRINDEQVGQWSDIATISVMGALSLVGRDRWARRTDRSNGGPRIVVAFPFSGRTRLPPIVLTHTPAFVLLTGGEAKKTSLGEKLPPPCPSKIGWPATFKVSRAGCTDERFV